MLRIMAGMDQWGYFSGMDYAGFTGDPTPRAVSSASGVFHLPLSSSTLAVARAGWFCWLRYTSSCVLRRGDSTGAVFVKVYMPVVVAGVFARQCIILWISTVAVWTVLEGILFVGKFVWLAGLLLSPSRQGRCGRKSPCGICSCRFLRCLMFLLLSTRAVPARRGDVLFLLVVVMCSSCSSW